MLGRNTQVTGAAGNVSASAENPILRRGPGPDESGARPRPDLGAGVDQSGREALFVVGDAVVAWELTAGKQRAKAQPSSSVVGSRKFA